MNDLARAEYAVNYAQRFLFLNTVTKYQQKSDISNVLKTGEILQRRLSKLNTTRLRKLYASLENLPARRLLDLTTSQSPEQDSEPHPD